MNSVTGPIPLGEEWEARIYHEWVIPSSLIEAWEGLAQDYGAPGIFLGPEWFEQWWKSFGKSEKLFVITMEEGGKTKAIFPCWIKELDNESRKGSIASLTNDYSHYYDFLVQPTVRKMAVSNLINLLQSIKPNSTLIFDYLCSNSGTSSDLEMRLRNDRFPVHKYTEPYAPYIDLKSLSWEDYYKNLSYNHKQNLKKKWRKAEKEGTLSFEVARQSTSLDELLTEVFEVEYRSWKGTQGSAIKCLPEVERFYRGIARWASEKGNFWLFNLRLNNRLVAFYFCLESQGTIFWLKTGYDETSFSHLSPGKLLMFEMLKYLFTEPKVLELNFPGPCAGWMMEWTTLSRDKEWIQIYPRSLVGWYEYWYRYGWKVYLKQFNTVRRIKTWVGR